MVNNTLNITNETELHYKVVDYIRKYFIILFIYNEYYYKTKSFT